MAEVPARRTERLPGLNADQTVFARAIASGVRTSEACALVDWPPARGRAAMRTPAVQRAVRLLSQGAGEQRVFTRDLAHDLYMQAYALADRPLDMIKAVDGLVKLFGLAPHPLHTIDDGMERVVVDFSSASDDDLMRAAGTDEKSLLPVYETDKKPGASNGRKENTGPDNEV